MKLVRTDEEIDEQLNRAQDQVEAGGTKVPGMSYEEGVDAALRWATGQSNDAPMDE